MLDSKMIDEAFQDQAIALKQAGFNTSIINFETETIRARPNFAEDEVIVYRGWMLSSKELDIMLDQIDLMGGKPLTDRDAYYAAHYIPNWYPLISRWTPEVVSFGNSSETPERVYNFAAGAFSAKEGMKLQIKDYVKSLKTAGGSVVTSADEIKDVLANMEKFRGTIEGGVVLRRYEEFFPGSEVRYFVINGRYYAQEQSFDLRHMSLLELIAREIPSPFYSVDIALRTDGAARIVEIGDGQVSDLVGWSPERFAQIWNERQ